MLGYAHAVSKYLGYYLSLQIRGDILITALVQGIEIIKKDFLQCVLHLLLEDTRYIFHNSNWNSISAKICWMLNVFKRAIQNMFMRLILHRTSSLLGFAKQFLDIVDFAKYFFQHWLFWVELIQHTGDQVKLISWWTLLPSNQSISPCCMHCKLVVIQNQLWVSVCVMPILGGSQNWIYNLGWPVDTK